MRGHHCAQHACAGKECAYDGLHPEGELPDMVIPTIIDPREDDEPRTDLPENTPQPPGASIEKTAGSLSNAPLPPIKVPMPTVFHIPKEPPAMTPIFNRESFIQSLPKEIRNRFAKDDHNRIVMQGGTHRPPPTNETENTVIRGLNWLRDHQNNDGSWGEKNRGAMTGLALLCFLGHGETGDSKHYGYNVNKAIQWVVDQGTLNQGRLSMTKDGWGPGNGGVYEHGILTYALGEYFTMTQEQGVTELLRQAVGHIVQGQGPDGGWMYHYDKSQGDTSVTGWQVQALKAAHLTKLNIPGIDTALDRAMKHFDRVQGPNGGYGYRTPGDRYSLSGVGVLSELFWTGKRDSNLRDGVKFILDQSEKGIPRRVSARER
jgi:hypothetical protein